LKTWHNEEFHHLYASPNIRVIKSKRWTGHVACMEYLRNAYKILVKKPEGKRLHRRPSHTCGVYIRVDLREMG
jgi:hypothetical protein